MQVLGPGELGPAIPIDGCSGDRIFHACQHGDTRHATIVMLSLFNSFHYSYTATLQPQAGVVIPLLT